MPGNKFVCFCAVVGIRGIPSKENPSKYSKSEPFCLYRYPKAKSSSEGKSKGDKSDGGYLANLMLFCFPDANEFPKTIVKKYVSFEKRKRYLLYKFGKFG